MYKLVGPRNAAGSVPGFLTLKAKIDPAKNLTCHVNAEVQEHLKTLKKSINSLTTTLQEEKDEVTVLSEALVRAKRKRVESGGNSAA